jgi:glycosyltransferase involved in cell wall biosynthesis
VADPIRVLWLIKGLGPGGAERSLVDAAPHVDRQRFRYSAAYLLPWKDHLADELRTAGVPTRCLQMRNAGDPSWIPRLRRLVKEERIDLVHAHLPSVATGARLGLAGVGRPAIISTEHNVWQRLRPMTRRLDALTFGMQEAAIAVSAAVRTSMGPRRRHPQVTVIPNGVDLTNLRTSALPAAEARAELGLPADAPVIGTVGGVTPKKGHLVLVEAARRVLETVPETRFVIVGLPADDLPVRAAIESGGLADRVILAGYRPKAARLMPAFDVYCLPSFYEGMPVSLLEAMALGLPSVATTVGGIPEVAADGRDALLVPPGEPGVLADRLVRLLGDAELRARLAAGARETANGFDIRTTVKRTEALYSMVIEARR